MKKPVLAGAFITSLVLAAVNNLTSRRGIDWIGSPDVLEKPTGWPSTGFAQGVAAGIKVGWKGFLAHDIAILAGLVFLALVIFFFNRTRRTPVSSMVRSAFRLGLAALFLTAAYPKFHDPKGFAILVAQYQFLPGFLVNGFALWLSAFEIVVGLGLILTTWEKEFSALTGLLLLMFIIALGQALGRDLGIACGCFDIEGAADVGETWFSLVRDVVLLAPVAWLTLSGGRRLLWESKGH